MADCIQTHNTSKQYTRKFQSFTSSYAPCPFSAFVFCFFTQNVRGITSTKVQGKKGGPMGHTKQYNSKGKQITCIEKSVCSHKKRSVQPLISGAMTFCVAGRGMFRLNIWVPDISHQLNINFPNEERKVNIIVKRKTGGSVKWAPLWSELC